MSNTTNLIKILRIHKTRQKIVERNEETKPYMPHPQSQINKKY